MKYCTKQFTQAFTFVRIATCRSLTQTLLAFAALTTLAAVIATPAFAQTVTLDRVVAVVDDSVIMASELDQQVITIHQRWAQQGNAAQLPPIDVLRSQILESLISDEIQLNLARMNDVTLTDEEMAEYLTELRMRNNHTEEQFLQQLAQDGLSLKEFKDQVNQQFMISQVQQSVMRRRVRISEHDIESFLKSKEGQVMTSPEYQLGHILISVSSSSSESQVREAQTRANEIVEQLRAGADFAEMAITYSSGQFALEGGNLGWRKPEEMPGLFADQIPNMKKGDTSDPFRSGAGFHILQVLDQRGGEERLVEQSKARHILLKTSEILNDEQAEKKLLNFREQVLTGKQEFGALAKANSEDIGSKQSGGDLGWSEPGRFVPEFEKVMKETEVGEISMPFKSQFGWHIMIVDERRKQDMSDQDKRNQAAEIIFRRRSEEELPIWLREIRDQAFVDIKLNNEVAEVEGPTAANN